MSRMGQRPKVAPREDVEAFVGATVWGPFHVCSVCGCSWLSVPRVPSHPLDTPAEFTSLTRSPFPPQGRSLSGDF